MKRLILYHLLLLSTKVTLGLPNSKILSTNDLVSNQSHSEDSIGRYLGRNNAIQNYYFNSGGIMNKNNELLSNYTTAAQKKEEMGRQNSIGKNVRKMGKNNVPGKNVNVGKYKSQTYTNIFGGYRSTKNSIQKYTNSTENNIGTGANENIQNSTKLPSSIEDKNQTTQNNKTILIEPRKDKALKNDDEHVEPVTTFDDFYYDWNFGFGNLAPGLGKPDAKAEGVTTTDISCWDCDEENGESSLLVRCDYTLIFNASMAPKGFACMQYQVTVGSKIFNKGQCVNAPSSFYDPCEEVVRNIVPPKRVQNCKICWHDGCNAACPEVAMSVVPLLVLLPLLLLCCLFAICLGAHSRLFCVKQCS